MDEERRSWFDERFETYGAIRLWLIGLLGPALVVSVVRSWVGHTG